jgi:hypothetical protein
MLNVTCKHLQSNKLSTLEQSAYCYDRFINVYLLSPASFSQVFFLGELGKETDYYRFDCGDAKFVAIHRLAVHILLPYVEMLDNLSWWESQQVAWRVAAGCLPESGIGNGNE